MRKSTTKGHILGTFTFCKYSFYFFFLNLYFLLFSLYLNCSKSVLNVFFYGDEIFSPGLDRV